MTSISKRDMNTFIADLKIAKGDWSVYFSTDTLTSRLSGTSKEKLKDILDTLYGEDYSDINRDGRVDGKDLFSLASTENSADDWWVVGDEDLDGVIKKAEAAKEKLPEKADVKQEKPADAHGEEHKTDDKHDAKAGEHGNADGHEAKAGEAKADPHANCEKVTRPQVASKPEDQDKDKANLGGRGEKFGWTDYTRLLGKKDVTSVADIQKIFDITEKAAKAIYDKANALVKAGTAKSLTDGVGCILQDIDIVGGHDGKLTIGEFNDYVEGLLAATPEKAEKTEKEKKTSSSGGSGKSKKVDSKDDTDDTEVDELEDKIAELEKEIEELKEGKTDAAEDTAKKKKGSNKWLLAGAGLLAAAGAFFFIKDRKDRQRYAEQMNNRPQPFCPPPVPFCPPVPPPQRFCAPPFNGPANQNMFGNLFAQC